MKLVKIEVIFETCECVEYEYGKDFRFFDIGDVKVGFSSFSNGIWKYQYVDGFTLVLSEDADTTRLGNDVTQLNLTYHDGEVENYSVEWPSEGDEYYHSGQKKITTDTGKVVFVSECGGYVSPSWVTDGEEVDCWFW